jgi:hypothetical protein
MPKKNAHVRASMRAITHASIGKHRKMGLKETQKTRKRAFL